MFRVCESHTLVNFSYHFQGMLQLDYAPPHRDRDGLSTVLGSQLVHNVLDVNLDGLLGDKEPFANVAVAISAGDVPEDVDLARGESVIAHVLGELRRHLRRNALLSRVHLANHLHQLAGGHVLQEIAASTGLQSTLNLNVAFERCEHDDAGFRKFCADCNHRIDSAQVRESQVHERYVGAVVSMVLDRFGATAGLGYQHHIRLIVDYRRNPLPDKWMVIDTEDADLGWLGHDNLTR
jgi:hypothetical protein